MCNEAFYTTFRVLALLTLCPFISLGLRIRPSFSIQSLILANYSTTTPSLNAAFGNTLNTKNHHVEHKSLWKIKGMYKKLILESYFE